MDNQAFELRRAGLLQMRGQPEYIDLYGAEFDSILEDLQTDPDEDRRKAQIDRLKLDGRHQIAFLMTLYMSGLANGEDKAHEAQEMQN